MKSTVSIKENRVYRLMYNRAKSVVLRNIVVYARPNGKTYNRLGLTSTKTVGKAVERNRSRRLMKEAYRLNEDKIKSGFDFILVARTRCKDAVYSDVEKDLLTAFSKLSLFL